MIMKETKVWYASKGVWGSVIVIASIVLRLLSKESEAQVVEAESGAIAEWIVQVVAAVGAVIAFWGRVTAKKELTG